MRFHTAAAILLATQSVNGFTLNLGSSINGVQKMIKKPSWGTGLLRMIPNNNNNNDNDPVAGAFNDMANDMKKQQDESLQALRDLSASFKQLAQTDLNNLFGGSQQGEGAAGGIPAAEESLDSAAPLAGNTFSSPHQHTFYSDHVQVQKNVPPPPQPPSSQPATTTTSASTSYAESLKQSANFSNNAPPAPPAAPAASAGPQSSYLDSMSSSSPPPGTPGLGGGGSSYLDAIQGQASTPTTTTESFSTSTTSTPQETGTTAGSSYLDALQGHQAPSSPPPAAETTGVGSSYLDAIAGTGAGAQSSPPKSYAPVSSSSTTTPATTVPSSGGSYLDALQQGAASTTTSSSSWASSRAPSAPAAASQPGSYLDSIAGAVSMTQQQEGQGIGYTPPPSPPPQQPQQQQQQPPVVDYQQQQPPPQQQVTNPYMGEPTIAYSDPTTPVDATIVDFSPDNEDAMLAGAAPKIETPYQQQQQQQQQPVQRVRNVQPSVGFNPDLDWNGGNPPESAGSSDRMSVGAQKVSGYIPDLQGGQGMNGATNIPEPKPKTSRPVFSKKMSGIHSDYDEQVVPPPPPQPTAAGNNNHFNPFSPPPGGSKAPMSVFAEKVSGLAADSDMMVNPGSQKAPLTPEPKPRRVSVAAQRVKDIPDWQNDFAHPTPDVTKPQAPVSVFAKRVKGVPDFNTPNNEESSSRKPEPPMSVFSQKIKGVANFDATGAPPPPPGSVPRPEPPRSVFAQRVSSNVPRSQPPSVAASSGGDFAANGNVPVPNPRVAPAPQQQEQQQYHQQQQQQQQYQQQQHYGQPPQPYGRGGMAGMTGQSNDFSPDFEDAMDAGAPREIPLPDYQNYNTPNHQDHLTNLGSSFLVNPDDRIGSSTRDEYLR